jgi:hypothetical protein
MAYIKIADTEHGELGHNGWTWVLNNPYPADDHGHPAFYEETGVLTVAPTLDPRETRDLIDPEVRFSKIFRTTRGGLVPREEIYIPVTVEQARLGQDNRDAYDAVHRPVGGYRIIVD